MGGSLQLHLRTRNIDVPDLVNHLTLLIVSAYDVIGLISCECESGHQREAVPLRIDTSAVEFDPRVRDCVACVAVVGCNHVEEVGLDVVAGVTHIGVAHYYCRAFVGLGFVENVVTELAELAQNRLYVGIALGVAAAAVGVHVGDIHVNDNVVCRIHGYLIVAESLLDAGVGTASKAALSIVILHVGLPCRACRAVPPEEIQAVGVGGGIQLCGRYASSPGAVGIVGEARNKLRIIREILTCGNEVPTQIIGNSRHSRCAVLTRAIRVGRANYITDIRQSVHIKRASRKSPGSNNRLRVRCCPADFRIFWLTVTSFIHLGSKISQRHREIINITRLQ